MQTVLSCQKTAPVIHSFRDTIHSLQLSFYWFKSAEDDIKANRTSIELSHDGDNPDPITMEVAPTLINMKEKLEFIENRINRLARRSLDYLEQEVAMSPRVRYLVEHAYDKVMEASFNNEISKTYYDEYRKQPRRPGGA